MDEKYYEPILLFIFGLIALLFARGRQERKRKILRNCKEVQGNVTKLVSDDGIYYPVVVFEIEGRKPVIKRYSEGYSPSRYRVNENITVQYFVDNPEEFLIKDDRIDWIKIGLPVLGILLILTAISVYFHLIPPKWVYP